MSNIKTLENELIEYKNQLINHPLYHEIKSLNSIQKFMEAHVFAVWDFMSLLKGLQIGLTCTTVPWTPKGNPITRRLVNEIVLGEESDVDEINESKSHFEMYLDSMNQIGANTSEVERFVLEIEKGSTLNDAFNQIEIPKYVKTFVSFTIDCVNKNDLHIIAAVFTFGREDLIPDMFIEIVKNIGKDSSVEISKLIYYLERHIEVDGGEHGPMALKMIDELCGIDSQKWNDAIEYSKRALQQRILLWDGILESILIPA